MKTRIVIFSFAFALLTHLNTQTLAQDTDARDCTTPLTVRIVTLKAYQHGQQNIIKWTSINEINIDYYEIQRSSNGTDFLTIGVRPATGNGAQGATYSFIDMNTLIGNNMYRLKVFDKSGKSSFSSTTQVKDEEITRVYPIPVTDILHIQTNSNTHFFLIDQAGRILTSVTVNGKGILNVSNLRSGLYYLRNNNTGNVQEIIVAR